MPVNGRIAVGVLVLCTIILKPVGECRAESALGLSDCIRQALAHNPAFQAIGRTVERAEARAGEVGADRYPSLSLSGSAWRFSEAGPIDEDYSGGVSVQYDLYRGGRTRARVQEAEIGIRVAESQREASRQDLIFRVTEAYYRVMEQARLVDVALQRAERTDVHLSVARARLRAGLATRSDTLRAAVEHSVAVLTIVRARNDLDNARGALNVLLGREAQSPLSLAPDPDSEVVSPVNDFEAYLFLALSRRPELQQARAAVDQQRAEAQAVRAEYLPRISLNASYAWNGSGLASLDRDWRAGVTLNLPLFTGFSTRFRVAQASAMLQQFEAEHAALRQEVGRQAWEAYRAVQEAGERIDETAVLVAQARERMAVAEGEYREGVGSMVDVVDAQAALTEADEARVSAFADYRVAQTRLVWACGNAQE